MHYQPIMEKIKKMRFFTINTLSQANKAEMIKSMIMPQSFYWFQAFKLPASIVYQIERTIRNFLWKGTGEKKYTIQPDWKQICSTKEERGLGMLYLCGMTSQKLRWFLICSWRTNPFGLHG